MVRRSVISLVVLAVLVGMVPAVSADTSGDIRARLRVTSVDRSGRDITVRGKINVRDLTGTYTIVRCSVDVEVGGDHLGRDSVEDGFTRRTVLRWRVEGVDPGGHVNADIRHCHSFADA